MIVIGITGTLGAGKGAVVDYLTSQKGFRHFSIGGFLKEKLAKKKLPASRNNLQEMGNALRKRYGPSYLAEKLYQEAIKGKKAAVIESIRNPQEAAFIKKHGFLIAIDAKPRLRFLRIKKRMDSKDKVTFKEFQNQERKEKKSDDPNHQNLTACMALANYKLTNNGTIKELNNKVEKLMAKITEPKKESKEKKYLRPSWDDYFMEVAEAISKRGTCDRGRSGCVMVKDNQILASGYAASPSGFPHCDDVGHQMKKMVNEDGIISQHCVRTVHAEQNAICQAAKKGISIDGATIYLRMTPCRVCAMLLVNSGIRRVLAERKYHAGAESEQIFKKAGIKITYKYNEVQKYTNQKD